MIILKTNFYEARLELQRHIYGMSGIRGVNTTSLCAALVSINASITFFGINLFTAVSIHYMLWSNG